MTSFLNQTIQTLQLERRVTTIPRLVDDFTQRAKHLGDDPEAEILESLKDFHQEDRLPGLAYVDTNDLEVFRRLAKLHSRIPKEYIHALNLLLASKRVLGRKHEEGLVVTLNPEKLS